jgi:hypothetical protein
VTKIIRLDMPLARTKYIEVPRDIQDWRVARSRPWSVDWIDDGGIEPLMRTGCIAVEDVYEPTDEHEVCITPAGVQAVEIWRIR